jgi:hypothetical protein
MQDDLSLSIIVEIFNECTEVNSSYGILYLRHFSQVETSTNLLKKSRYIEAARKKGLPTEKEALDFLLKEGMWEKEQEEEIKKKKEFVENLKTGLSKLQLPSAREKHKELIKEEENKFKKMSFDRSALIGLTAETYADKVVNRDFFESIAYFDRDFREPVLKNISYDAKETELEITKIQEEFFKKFSEKNISTAVLSPAYSAYLPFSEDIMSIFGKPLKDLSNFQLRLCSFGRTFLNIFKNSPKEIPEYIAKDPELLLEFAESLRNERKGSDKKASQGDGGSVMFGATKADIEAVKKEHEDAVTLDEALNKEGKSGLNMQDLMKMHGV